MKSNILSKIVAVGLVLTSYTSYGQTLPPVSIGGIQTSLTTDRLRIPPAVSEGMHYDYQIALDGTVTRITSYVVPPKRIPFKVTASISNRNRYYNEFVFDNASYAVTLWRIVVTDSSGAVVWRSTDNITSENSQKIVRLLPGRSFTRTVVIDPSSFKQPGTYHIYAGLIGTPTVELSTIVVLE